MVRNGCTQKGVPICDRQVIVKIAATKSSSFFSLFVVAGRRDIGSTHMSSASRDTENRKWMGFRNGPRVVGTRSVL